MILTLTYQFYSRNNFSCADKFKHIVQSIDNTYTHSVSNELSIFTPIAVEDVKKVKDKGYSILYKDIGASLQMPHFVVKQIEVSFYEIPDDFKEVCDHLLDLYGEYACKYRIFEEVYIKDPS